MPVSRRQGNSGGISTVSSGSQIQLKDVAPAADRMSHCPENHEGQANDEHDQADRPNERRRDDKPKNKKDAAQENHGDRTTFQ
jgi:hypothetical protein